MTLIYRKENRKKCFVQLVKHHLNIKVTTDVNPSKFLDTKLTNINGFYKFNIFLKCIKLPTFPMNLQNSKTL